MSKDQRVPEHRFSDDSDERGFHAKITRRGRARAIGASRRRQHIGRRTALLAAAVALPSMAAPGAWPFASAGAEPLAQDDVAPMGFETPGESFPGSAFYYLADTPYQPRAEVAAYVPGRAIGETPVARGLTAAGTAIDRRRAQRCLTMAIYYEAAAESDAGQRAVAQVVLNRVAHPSYPNSVCGVVFQGSERSTGCQFTFTCDGSLARAPSRQWWDRAAKVARSALAGAVYEPVGLATHYHTLAVHPYWADSLQRVGVIGSHLFYRWRGAAGMPAAFHSRYFGGEPLAAPHPRHYISPDRAEDPVSLAQAYERSVAAAAAEVMPIAIDPAPSPEHAVASAIPTRDTLPQPGTVKGAYVHSGRWIRQPGHIPPKSDTNN